MFTKVKAVESIQTNQSRQFLQSLKSLKEMKKADASKLMLVAASLLSVISYSIYYIVEYLSIEHKEWAEFISIYGTFASISLFTLGLGIVEKNRWLKFMVYYSASFFFAWTSLIYILNSINDSTISINIPMISTILSVISCFIIYFFKRNSR